MKKFLDNLPGNGVKTYVVAAAAGLVVALHSLGIIDAGVANSLLAFLGAGAVVTIRHALDKMSSKK